MDRTDDLGTFACPICAWPKPHAHTPEEIAERPAIDWARLEFEKQAREFMAGSFFNGPRTGFWWAYPAHLARQTEDKYGIGWAARDYPQGPYTNEFVQIMWVFWRMAWLAASTKISEYVRELRDELDKWRPLAPEEVDKAMDEAEAVPMSEERIKAIVDAALNPAHALTNQEEAQIAVRYQRASDTISRLSVAVSIIASEPNGDARMKLAKAVIGGADIRNQQQFTEIVKGI